MLGGVAYSSVQNDETVEKSGGEGVLKAEMTVLSTDIHHSSTRADHYS
jgi:hypothetical protein